MPAATTNTTLPTGIEIFRAGTRTADNGETYTITVSDIAAAAAAYDPALHEAPLVVGHPKDNLPAYGWIGSLQVDGDVLKIATHNQVEPQFAEMVSAGRFKKRSASFYQPDDPTNPKPGVWYPRHVAWLGAQPPAVKGLKDVQFSEAAQAVSFSEPIAQPTQEQEDMSKELQAQLDEANAKLKAEAEARAKAEADAADANKKADEAQAQTAQFAENAKATRKTQLVSFAETQVQAGRLLPKDKDLVVATLVALDASAPAEFSEGDTTRKVSLSQFVQDLIAGSAAKVQFGEFAPGKVAAGGGAKGKSDAEIDQAARAHMAQHKVSYAEALTAVTSFEA